MLRRRDWVLLTYSRVELTTRDAVKGKDVDHQGDAKGKRYVQKRCNIGHRNAIAKLRRHSIGDPGGGEGKEEEKEGSNKLGECGRAVVAEDRRQRHFGTWAAKAALVFWFRTSG